MQKSKCELLAPAGSIEALKAAVYAGADAVYFGGGSFNARAYAKNFDTNDMNKAFDICRSFGVKAYLVINTVLTDKEIPKVLQFVDELEINNKPDAYIVQDIGLISQLKQRYPDITLHASTQMQLHSSLSASAAKHLGIERIVFARELNKADIEQAAKCGLETELFIHGAVCVCQSGGCLMSSFMGGRSGNRGRCAQPCRQSYNGLYPLSLKDMCYAKHIPEILNMGIDSLKIEGRMKSAEYVYETVSVYRTIIDENRAATNNEIKRLSAAFSRSGFTDGYYTSSKGISMFGIRTDADKEISRRTVPAIVPKKLNVSIFAVIKKNQKAYIKAVCGDISYEVFGDVPDEAINRPLSEDSVKTRLLKTGDTYFVANKCDVVVDSNLILPLSSINGLRRTVLEGLNKKLIEFNTPKTNNNLSNTRYTEHIITRKSNTKPKLVARFDSVVPSNKVLKTVLEVCDRIELPIWCRIPSVLDSSKLSLVLPRTVFDSDTTEICALIKKAKIIGINNLTASNIGMLQLCEGFVVHGDYSLNVTNQSAALSLMNLGFNTVIVSPEVIPDHIAKKVSGTEYIVYGKIPLMHTETCIINNVKGCEGKERCFAMLNDKTGATFPIMREYKHRNNIYNSVPTYLLDKIDNLNMLEAHILFFTNETDDEINQVLKMYNNHSIFDKPYTRGAYRRTKEVF